MTREERNTKLKNLITCLKCEESGRECDANCHVQYEAGNMGEIIENLEVISKALEQETKTDAIPVSKFNLGDNVIYGTDGNLYKITVSSGKEYEQEPCKDAIGRSDMLDAVGHGTTYTSEDLQKIIKGLPPVNPQPCDAAISRQWLMECVNEGWIKFDTEKDENRFIHLIRDIAPPANPQPNKEDIAKAFQFGMAFGFGEKYDKTDKVINEITKVITPQPKTGRWIFDKTLDEHYYCSECKSMGVDYWDFCPYCGAKMIEPQESEG